jgi:hypothetical protein
VSQLARVVLNNHALTRVMGCAIMCSGSGAQLGTVRQLCSTCLICTGGGHSKINQLNFRCWEQS